MHEKIIKLYNYNNTNKKNKSTVAIYNEKHIFIQHIIQQFKKQQQTWIYRKK